MERPVGWYCVSYSPLDGALWVRPHEGGLMWQWSQGTETMTWTTDGTMADVPTHLMEAV